MAREDIIMDAEYGEVEMSGRVAGKTFHNFRLLDSVEDADNADFRHGEITVPATSSHRIAMQKVFISVFPIRPTTGY